MAQPGGAVTRVALARSLQPARRRRVVFVPTPSAPALRADARLRSAPSASRRRHGACFSQARASPAPARVVFVPTPSARLASLGRLGSGRRPPLRLGPDGNVVWLWWRAVVAPRDVAASAGLSCGTPTSASLCCRGWVPPDPPSASTTPNPRCTGRGAARPSVRTPRSLRRRRGGHLPSRGSGIDTLRDASRGRRLSPVDACRALVTARHRGPPSASPAQPAV